MKITGLFVYPLKSGPAVSLDSVQTLERGLAHDRRFMVVDAAGKFLSQRTHPVLGRLKLSVQGDVLVLGAEGGGEVTCPLQPPKTATQEVRVWSDTVAAHGVSADADALLTEVVGAPSRLVYMPDDARRPVEGYADVAVSFADGYPVLVCTTASLVDLNRRIEGDDLPMAAFRPNVVIDTDAAWAEDNWDALIGPDSALLCTTGCERCSMTTLDPAAPRRPRPDGEPLRTLAKFRRNDAGKVIFGRNALVRTPGTLRVGDVLEAVASA